MVLVKPCSNWDATQLVLDNNKITLKGKTSAEGKQMANLWPPLLMSECLFVCVWECVHMFQTFNIYKEDGEKNKMECRLILHNMLGFIYVNNQEKQQKERFPECFGLLHLLSQRWFFIRCHRNSSSLCVCVCVCVCVWLRRNVYWVWCGYMCICPLEEWVLVSFLYTSFCWGGFHHDLQIVCMCTCAGMCMCVYCVCVWQGI